MTDAVNAQLREKLAIADMEKEKMRHAITYLCRKLSDNGLYSPEVQPVVTEALKVPTATDLEVWHQAKLGAPVMYFEMQESCRNLAFGDVYFSHMYSTRVHKEAPNTSNPVIKLYAEKAEATAEQAIDESKCKKCGGDMVQGQAIGQTFTGIPDFPGDNYATTISPGGPGKLIKCRKCSKCGWSVS